MAMVFMPQDDCYPEHHRDALILRRLGLDSNVYFCAARIPLEEFESQDPAHIAEYYIRQSCTHHWHKRGMRMIQHLDIITLGLKAYIILDNFMAPSSNLEFKPIPGCPSFVLGGPIASE